MPTKLGKFFKSVYLKIAFFLKKPRFYVVKHKF